MRVVLLSPPYGEGPQLVMPLGMMNIAAYVNRELHGEVVAEVRDFSSSDAGAADELLDVVPWQDVAVVGFSVYSSHLKAVREWAEGIRVRNPHIVIIAGGPHPTLAWEHFTLSYGDVFDAVVVGEGEQPFTEIVRAVHAGESLAAHSIPGVARLRDGRPHLNPVGATIDPECWVNPFDVEVHTADHEQLMFSDHVSGRRRSAVAFTTSRSCPMRCYFCSIIAMPDKYRSASPEQVTRWLVEENQRRPFEHAYLMDADFFTTRQRVMAFAESMHAALPNMTWSTSATVGHLLRLTDDLDRLFECGLRLVEMGMEAGSNAQLSFLGKKNFGKDATWEQSLRAVTALQQKNIAIGVDYIMFYPHQTLEQLAENLVFLRRASLLDEEDDGHYWSDLLLYPGTPLRDFYQQLTSDPLDLDDLPSTDGMFVDERVRRIKNIFRGEYRTTTWARALKLREELREAARGCDVPSVRAQLRICEISLRHHPYRVLEGLIRTEGAPLDVAAPWLSKELSAADRLLDASRESRPTLAVAG